MAFLLLLLCMVSHLEGQPVAVVSSESNNRLNLGKKAFSRGRSQVRGWKLGHKPTPVSMVLVHQ